MVKGQADLSAAFSLHWKHNYKSSKLYMNERNEMIEENAFVNFSYFAIVINVLRGSCDL